MMTRSAAVDRITANNARRPIRKISTGLGTAVKRTRTLTRKRRTVTISRRGKA